MIYTSYYNKQANRNDENTAYAKISIGRPKFDLACNLVEVFCLKPFGIFGEGIDDETSKKLYREKLDYWGVDKIRRALEYAQGDKEHLILLCFEKDPLKCHRSWFAEWWLEKTGEEILEFVDTPQPQEKVVEQCFSQMSLFDL